MRVLWIGVVLLLMSCSKKQHLVFENGCNCTTDIYIMNKGYVAVKAHETNSDFGLWFFSVFEHAAANSKSAVINYKIRQHGVIYQYEIDDRQYDQYAFTRKYMKETSLMHDEYRYRVDGNGQLFILDKDGDWNALTAIGYTLKLSKG